MSDLPPPRHVDPAKLLAALDKAMPQWTSIGRMMAEVIAEELDDPDPASFSTMLAWVATEHLTTLNDEGEMVPPDIYTN